jgi:HEAT repeat protein
MPELVEAITSTVAGGRRRRGGRRAKRGLTPFGAARRRFRRRARYAAALERPEDATLRALARTARSEAGICDLGAEADLVWARLLPADRDMFRYHLRAAGVQATLRRATRSWLARRRARAATAMGDLRLSEGVSDLERLLRGRDARVRLAAARALGRIATPESARLLIGALEQGLVPEQRLVEVLGEPWAATPLLLAFRAPRTVALRVPLADALGRTGSVAAVDTFVAAMPAAGTELRIRMVRALTRIGTPAAVAAVRGAMSDPHGRVRAQAAWSLARLGDPAATALLERGLHDSAPWVRANCTAALRRLATPPAAPLR